MGESFRYPLSLQTVLPDDYPSNRGFESLLGTLRELGFWGLELNIGDPRGFAYDAVHRYLQNHGLEFSMLATGLTAHRLDLSLSSSDERVRSRSVAVCRELIDWIGNRVTGVIIGYLKGGQSPDREEARRRFARSLSEVVPRAEERHVRLLIEATNRYETAIANTVDEAAAFVEEYGPDVAQILPDTFHMNIEEADPFGALRRRQDRYASLHLSDNNRYFPGFGAIDFTRFIALLDEIGYRGRLAIEGNIVNDLVSDARKSVAHLAPLLSA